MLDALKIEQYARTHMIVQHERLLITSVGSTFHPLWDSSDTCAQLIPDFLGVQTLLDVL